MLYEDAHVFRCPGRWDSRFRKKPTKPSSHHVPPHSSPTLWALRVRVDPSDAVEQSRNT